MASESASASTATDVGSTSAPTIWKDFNLCIMTDNSQKAQCKHCFHFLSVDSNTTLRNHIEHPHCEAKKLSNTMELHLSYVPNVQASSVASESAFSTSGRVLSIRRTRLTPASLEMCMCLKDHLDAKEHFEEDVFDEEVQRNEVIPLSDEEIALDASSEGTLSPGGPRYDYMMSSEAEDE
ncbi:zinc finger BED domain-containing protein RICESLEEPER 2 [Tanacetum coccineum]